MRRLVVATVVLALSLMLVGCGGGAEEPTPATTAPEQPAAAVPTAEGGAVAVPADVSPTETVTYEPLITATATAPAAVVDRIEAEKPMIVYYYDPAQPVTTTQNSILSALLEEYRGMVDLVSFDIGKYVKCNADGSFEIDKSLSEDENATKALELAESLGVHFTPYIVVTDSNGYIVYRGRGLVDKKTLEREVLRVGE